MWDNMFKIVALNLGFIAFSAIPIFLPMLVSKIYNSDLLNMIISAIGILICSVYLSAVSYSIRSISDYGNYNFGELIEGLKKTWLAGLVMGVFIFLLFLIVTIVIPFYISMEPPLAGLALSALIFWTMVFALLSLQYFFAVYNRLGSHIRKALKKCMLISLDNTGLSVFLIIHNTLALLLSVVFAFMFPGPAGVLIYIDEALRLRLLKYDYLEANPDANRRKIPWDALLIEEREKTGNRTFKNFIFPWKD